MDQRLSNRRVAVNFNFALPISIRHRPRPRRRRPRSRRPGGRRFRRARTRRTTTTRLRSSTSRSSCPRSCSRTTRASRAPCVGCPRPACAPRRASPTSRTEHASQPGADILSLLLHPARVSPPAPLLSTCLVAPVVIKSLLLAFSFPVICPSIQLSNL